MDASDAPQTGRRQQSVSAEAHAAVGEMPLKSAPLTPSASPASADSLPLSTSTSGVRRRQAEFHELFRSIAPSEKLLESYACALSREILVQGRLYIGERHVCFHANIIGWVTSVVIEHADIVSVDKRATAVIFQNAIQIATIGNRYFFTSFLARDTAYDRLVDAWRSTLLLIEPSTDGHGESAAGSSTDVFSDDVLAQDSHTDNMDALVAKVDAVLPGAPRARADSSCGCEAHFSTVLVRRRIRGRLQDVDALLLGDDSSTAFLTDFFASISCGLETPADPMHLAWICGSDGADRRRYTLRMPMPHLAAQSSGHVLASFTETRVLQDARRSVADVTLSVEGMPGGMCSLTLRLCLTEDHSESKKSPQTHMLVTAHVEPPFGAWFKDAIGRAISAHTAALYHEAARAAESRISTGTSFNVSGALGSMTAASGRWWQLENKEDSTAHNNVQQFFSGRAFLRNIMRFWPVFMAVALAAIAALVLRSRGIPLMPSLWSSGWGLADGESDRLRMADRVYSQLQELLAEEARESENLLKRASDSIARAARHLINPDALEVDE